MNVERTVELYQVHKINPAALLGCVNDKEWRGCKPQGLTIGGIDFTACMDWRLVRVRFRIIKSVDDLIGVSINFDDVLGIGREPTFSRQWEGVA